MDENRDRFDEDRRIDLDARDWIVRLTSGRVSEGDLQRFKAWRDLSPRHAEAFRRERLFWSDLGGLREDHADRAPAMHCPPSAGRRAFLLGSGAAVAAGVAALALPGLQRWWRTDLRTAVGEQARHELPDGTVVTLNTDSALAVDFGPAIRRVELLGGEAEFSVGKSSGAIFSVSAFGGRTEAGSAVFSVRAIDDLATVTVAKGSVLVSSPSSTDGADRLDIASNEQASYSAGGRLGPVTRVDVERELAWRNGKVIFEGRPFASAMAELGRYLPERIAYAPGASSNVPVTAMFSTSEALEAVYALARTQGRTVRRIPGVLVLIT
ncbi:FecR family protein [Shinella sp. BYT-45]|uniref:FecR family protein n=1 Tax=Shinella sp. BYT-45 TaxID=3377377 RepID=UPI00398051DD